jgi:hypothetical protein
MQLAKSLVEQGLKVNTKSFLKWPLCVVHSYEKGYFLRKEQIEFSLGRN